MNLLQAIQQSGDNWFRPVSWVGDSVFAGEAFCRKGDAIWRMPKHKIDMTCNAKFLLGEWEIVTPEQVIAERK